MSDNNFFISCLHRRYIIFVQRFGPLKSSLISLLIWQTADCDRYISQRIPPTSLVSTTKTEPVHKAPGCSTPYRIYWGPYLLTISAWNFLPPLFYQNGQESLCEWLQTNIIPISLFGWINRMITDKFSGKQLHLYIFPQTYLLYAPQIYTIINLKHSHWVPMMCQESCLK